MRVLGPGLDRKAVPNNELLCRGRVSLAEVVVGLRNRTGPNSKQSVAEQLGLPLEDTEMVRPRSKPPNLRTLEVHGCDWLGLILNARNTHYSCVLTVVTE